MTVAWLSKDGKQHPNESVGMSDVGSFLERDSHETRL